MKIELKGKDGSSHQIEDIWMAVHSKLIRNILKHSDENPNEAIELPLVEGDILTVIISWVKEKDSLKLDNYDSLFVCDLLVASEFMEIPLLSSTIITWLGQQISSGNISASDVDVFARNFLILDLEKLCLKMMQPRELVFFFGGKQESESPTSSISVMDPSTGVTNNLVEKLPFSLAYFGAVVEQSGIYLAGGGGEEDGSNGLFKLNLKDFTLTSLSKMSEKRDDLAVTSNGGFIYSLGGYNGTGDETLKTVEKYDINENQWYDCPPMREARAAAGAAALNGKIYICGGEDNNHIHSSVEVFDPEAGTWTMGKPMSKKRNGVKATVMNGKIYVVGGFSGENILSCGEVYDPNTDEWTPLPEMNVPRLNYSLFVADGQLVVAGGADGSDRLQTTEILNVRENKWVFGRNLMDAKCGSAAVSVSKEMIDPEVLKKCLNN